MMQCSKALRLATNLLPFATFMRAERQLHSATMSLILELPKTRNTAMTLANLFPDVESVCPESQGKLRWILKEWQGVFLSDRKNSETESQRGQTMALHYHDVACQHQQSLDQKCRVFGSYEETVFGSQQDTVDNSNLMIGSRPFESDGHFIGFLDTFYSISFSHDLNSDQQTNYLPLLATFMPKIIQQELNSSSLHGPTIQRNISICGSSDPAFSIAFNPSIVESTVQEPPNPFSVKLTGLFRSRSVDCVRDSPNVTRKNLLQAKKIDVLTLKQLTRRGSLTLKTSRTSTSPRNTNNNNAGGYRGHSPVCGFGRSASLLELHNDMSLEDSTGNLIPKYLNESVLSDADVKKMVFTGNYLNSEKMADWLNSYTSKNLGEWLKSGPHKTAMRVKVSPKMLTYALWLLEQRNYVVPRVDDVIVAVVQHGRPVSVPPQQNSTQNNNFQDSASDSSKKKHKKKLPKRTDAREERPSRENADEKMEDEYGTVVWGTKRFNPTKHTSVAAAAADVSEHLNRYFKWKL